MKTLTLIDEDTFHLEYEIANQPCPTCILPIFVTRFVNNKHT